MRQVSFTLLMNRYYDSNPAQYERNRRFGPVVLVLGREASGAKLPSEGLRLNASKSESILVTRSNTFRASILGRQCQVMCSLHSESMPSERSAVFCFFRVGGSLLVMPYFKEETFVPAHRVQCRPSSSFLTNMQSNVEAQNRL